MTTSALDVAKSWIPTLTVSPTKKIKPPKNGKYPALYKWLNTANFDQSKKLKSGYYVQSFMIELVKHAPKNYVVITDKYSVISNGEEKEADLLAKLPQQLVIVYREVKTNVNLDSEKMPATVAKIADISGALQKTYHDHEINSGLLNPCWLSSGSHNNVSIEGFNDFITILGYTELTVEEHAEIGNTLGEIIRNALIDS